MDRTFGTGLWTDPNVQIQLDFFIIQSGRSPTLWQSAPRQEKQMRTWAFLFLIQQRQD